MMIQESLLECRFFYIQSLIEFGEFILKTLRGVVSDWFLEDIEEAT